MREIVFDTETTGLDPLGGHRIVEIGCVELLNHLPTGRTHQCYVNPQRDMPVEAFNVHGLSAEFLAGHPVFADCCGAFLDFLEDSPLVIHNAAFDLGFLNAELSRCGRPAVSPGRALDTMNLARRRFPVGRISLDVLCQRLGIDNSHRTRHGALLDAELLAEVYLELIGGRQPGLSLAAAEARRAIVVADRPRREPRPHAPSPDELAAHEALVARLSDPVWRA